MFDRFKGSHNRLLVGIQFDKDTQGLVESAAALAGRAGMQLRLAHAVEPSHLATSAAYPGGYLAAKIALVHGKELHDDANARLKVLARAFEADLPIEISVGTGSASDVLEAEAMATRSSLIVCGYRPAAHRFVPHGLGTALALMSTSNLPTLAVPLGRSEPFDTTPFTVLVADDRREASSEALSTACELAYDLTHTRLIHLHVHGQSRRELEDWAAKLLEAMLLQDGAGEMPPSPDALAGETDEHLEKEMAHRIGLMKELLTSMPGNSYCLDIRYGDLLEQFAAALEEHEPRLLVFGRHHLLHKKPFAIGHVPFYAMLSLARPILVVPTPR